MISASDCTIDKLTWGPGESLVHVRSGLLGLGFRRVGYIGIILVGCIGAILIGYIGTIIIMGYIGTVKLGLVIWGCWARIRVLGPHEHHP